MTKINVRLLVLSYRLKIANISEKAGVARQTFYRNYENKDDIIIKCLNIFKKSSNEKEKYTI
ncbi:TetR family transcriptional regulator [Peribacillus sp. NPDC060186]